MSGSLHSNDMHGIQSNAMEKYPEYSEMKDLDFINVLYGRYFLLESY